jgi:hypothetical protein
MPEPDPRTVRQAELRGQLPAIVRELQALSPRSPEHWEAMERGCATYDAVLALSEELTA